MGKKKINGYKTIFKKHKKKIRSNFKKLPSLNYAIKISSLAPKMADVSDISKGLTKSIEKTMKEFNVNLIKLQIPKLFIEKHMETLNKLKDALSFNNYNLILKETKAIENIFKTLATLTIRTDLLPKIENINSPLLEMAKQIQKYSLTNILKEIYLPNFPKSINDFYSTLLYKTGWFPSPRLLNESDIYEPLRVIQVTSRGESKRREKRVDKVIIEYFTKQEIEKIQKEWNKLNIENYKKRAMRESINAYLRGEYILTISTLVPMGEDFIKEDKREIKQKRHKKVKDEFRGKVESLKMHPLIADYFENYMMSTCYTVEDRIEGIPNRHGVAHFKYKSYPTKKEALNSILFTDTLIDLLEQEKNEVTS